MSEVRLCMVSHHSKQASWLRDTATSIYDTVAPLKTAEKKEKTPISDVL